MITNKDRSGWFGASDTSMVVGNWETASFKQWWLVKLGLAESTLQTKAMKVGNAFEHKILETIPGVEMDKQILIPELHLRVNLDGNTEKTIHEVKTYKRDKFKVSAAYRNQAQVEMYAFLLESGFVPDLEIVAYQLTPEDYLNYFNPIDPNRLSHIPIPYDVSFIKDRYLPRLRYLGKCLEEGRMPKHEQIQ
jgi:hypothetical protein